MLTLTFLTLMAITPVIVDTAGTYTGSPLTRMSVPNVGINVGDNAFPAIQQGPFTNGANRYLVLANEGDFGTWNGAVGGGPAVPCVLRVWKSADAGLTWAEQDSGNAKTLPTYNNTNNTTAVTTSGFTSYACAQQGTVILIARLVWDGITNHNYTVVISRFSMASNTWLADLTATGDANAPVVANPNLGLDALGYVPLGIFLTVRPSDQNLFLTYGTNVIIAGSFRQTHGNHSYEHTRLSQWAPGPGWSAPVLLFSDDTIAQDFQPQGITVDRNNLLTFFSINIAGNAGTDSAPFTTNILCQTLTLLGVLSGNQNVTPANAADPAENELTVGVPMLRPNGAADEILVPYLGVLVLGVKQSLAIARATSAAAPVWTQQTISVDNTKYSDEFSGRGAFAAGYTNDGKVYVWSPGSSTSAIWQFTNAGAGWDAGVSLFAALVPFGLSSISAYHDSALNIQGVVFGNGPLNSSPYSDAWYFELGGAAPPPPPVPPSPPTYWNPGSSQSLLCEKDYPWSVPPKDRIPVSLRNSVPSPAANVLTELWSFQVPDGFWFVYDSLTFFAQVAGFLEGSGSLIFTLDVNIPTVGAALPVGRPLAKFTTNLGELSEMVKVAPVQLYQGDTLRAKVNITDNTLGVGLPNMIHAAVEGWLYPHSRL